MKSDPRSIITVLALFAVLSAAHAAGEITIYLHPNAELGERAVRIGDLGSVEGDEAGTEAISSIAVDPRFFEDGLIDRSEIREMVKDRPENHVRIVGNAVRITAKRAEKTPEQNGTRAAAITDGNVKSGDKVTLMINRKGISLQTGATALEDGKAGDTIRMRLKNAREVRGRVSASGDVEVWM